MPEYKAAKEAFVADNLGASIWSINAVSLFGLTAYALYASAASSRRPSPIVEYLTTVFPLLVGVTIASTRPFLWNLLFAIPVIYNYLVHASSSRSQESGTPRRPEKQSAGQWLDESDSDEEPAVPADPGAIETSPRIQLPSEIVTEATTTALSPSASPLPSPVPPSPNLSVIDSPTDGPSKRAWKRRHSPTPSTHTHTAISILPTPETPTTASMTGNARSYPSPQATRTAARRPSPAQDRLPFLSVYRAHMMIMTIHCILAVDFPVFPRWQGKCEDFGTSLMDVGVGSFVFSLGIVSTRSFASGSSSSATNILRLTWRSIRKSSPILLLGLIRVLMVKGTDYPEHVTEYGVHWNFFFTLGLLPVFGNLLWPIRQRFLRWSIMALLVSGVHQLALSLTTLQTWTLSSTRIGLVGMNKEGLVSLPGYLAIYLLGLATGEHILRTASPSDVKKAVSETPEQHAQSQYRKRRTELGLELFGYAVAWWCALGLCRAMGMEVSRRLANLTYVLWTASFNSTFLLGYLLVESALVIRPDAPPCPALLEAINANGLVIFLVANLLTGFVNLSIKTMYAGNGLSMAVLLAYSAGVCAFAWTIRKRRIKL